MEQMFLQLARCYEQEPFDIEKEKIQAIDAILEDAKKQYCGSCLKLEVCQEKKRKALLERGKLTPQDVVSYFTCHDGEEMIKVINHFYEEYLYRMRIEQEIRFHNQFFAKQYKNAAELLRVCGEKQGEKEKKEISIADWNKKIKAFGIEFEQIFYEEKRKCLFIFARVRSKKADKTAREISGILSELFHKKLKPQRECRISVGNMYEWMEFCEAPRFYILAGSRKITCENSSMSGEQFSLLNIKENLFVSTICDGLGTGVLAFQESKRVIEMFENLLENEIEEEMAVKIIKSSMNFSSLHERYVTLDCLLIDLHTGIGKWMKLGSAETFLLRGKQIECMAGTEPPIGLDSLKESRFVRKKFEHNDIIVMVSDGVVDAYGGSKEFMSFLETRKETCPQGLCDEICANIKEVKDDCTVLVLGLWAKA